MAIKFLSGLNLSNVTAGSILKLDSNGNIVAAVDGTDYNTGSADSWSDVGSDIYRNSDVRIGTYQSGVAPSARLHVFDYQTTDPKLLIEDGNTGDASMEFKISTQSYTMGIDNSDSDKFVLAASTALGTTNVLEVSTTGTAAFQDNLLVNGTMYSDAADISGRLDVASDLRIRGNSANIDQGVVRQYVNSSNTLFIDAGNDGNNVGQFKSDGSLILKSSNSQGLSIRQSADSGNDMQVEIRGSRNAPAAGVNPAKLILSSYDNDDGSGVVKTGAEFYMESTSLTGEDLSDFEVGLRYRKDGAVVDGISIHDGEVKAHGYLTVTGNELNLPSGGQLDWANGDARITEGLVTNYSLSFQTYTGSALTTKMFIQSGGNVGIGTTSPREKLDVDGDIVTTWGNDKFVGLQYQQGAAYQNGLLLHGDNRSTGLIAKGGTGSTPYIWFGVSEGGNTERMRITKDGNVGIGTTAPLEKLHVVGKINSSNNIVSNSTYTMFTGRSSRTVDDYGGLNKEYFKANLVTPGTNTTGESSAHGIADLRFQLANSAGNTSMSDIMTLRSGGNVGIGTTTPSDKLHVVGNATIHSGANSGQLKVGRGDNQEIKIYVDDTNNIITAYQDSDSNSTHIFALDREFDGSGANNFFIRKGGSNQLGLDTSGNLRLYSYTAGLLKTDANGNVSLDTNTYSTATGVEDNADVTDATNVAAAGALMKAGGTMSGTLALDNADSLSFESGKHWITYNDGEGNFNIRVGHKSDSSTNEVSTETGYVFHDEWSQTSGWREFNVSGTSITEGGDVGTWRRQMFYDYNDVRLSYQGGLRLQTTSAGVTVSGNIAATNFSGSSSGTNTGDQTLPTLSSLGALSTSAAASTYLPLAGGTMTGTLKLDSELQFLRGSTDYSNYIRAANYPSQNYTSSTAKYWLEYGAKGGHHFVVNTDGGAASAENAYDDFTIWQGAVDGDRLFEVTNVGNVTTAGKLYIGTTSATTTATTALLLGAAGEVKKRALGSNAFNSTTIPTGTASSKAVTDFIQDFGTSTTSNINTIGNASGKYRWNNTTTGRPASSQENEYGTLLNLHYSGNVTTQIAHDIDQANLWIRSLDTESDTGTAWKQIADTAYVSAAVAGIVDSAPAALDTLNELAAALGNDDSFSTTMSTALGNRLRIDVNNQSLSSTELANARTNLGLGTAATSNTGDFATSSHSHSIHDLTARRSGVNIDTVGNDNFWETTIGTQTDLGTKPTSYVHIVSFGDETAGIQFGSPYSSSTALYYRQGTDNGASENGANTYKNWRRLLATDGGTMTGDLTLDDGSGASPSLYLKNGDDNYWRIFNSSSLDLTFRVGTTTKFDIDSSGNGTFAGNITSPNLNVGNAIYHDGDNNTYIWFTTDRIRIDAGGVNKFDSNNTYVVDSAPAAPTNLSLSVVNDTINVTFTASATSGIDSYFVFSSVDGGDYSLISMIAPDDFGATMSIIDNAFDATGTQAYRIYAVKNGIISADLTGNISYSVTTPLEPTNMSVVNLNTAFYVQWDAPSTNARFVTAYNVYKHEHATESSLDRDSATLIYSGNNYSYMYQISGSDNNNFHKFWVETTVG